MKQAIQIRIAEPCHENWNNMSPTDQGRFCMSCQKQVVDFSTMTDKEILEHIAAASKGICGRAGNDQLNRLLVAPPEPRKIWWHYWMGLAASFVLLAPKTNAQVKHPKHPTVHTPFREKKLPPPSIVMGTVAMVKDTKPVTIQVSGKVVDEKNKAVPYATVRLIGGDASMAADSSGFFLLSTTADLSDLTLSVSSVGYDSKTIALSDTDGIKKVGASGGRVIIDMGHVLLSSQTMKEVVVIGNKTEPVSIVAGGISFCRKNTRYEKIKSSFKEFAGINEVRVYPNPVSVQGSFNISFTIKEPGRYNVQFTDAAGKILGGRQITITQNKQTEKFEGNLFTGSGIYFVSVISSQRNKVYTTRLFVQ